MAEYKNIDLDKHIEDKYGLAITEIFAKYGEARFREMETEEIRLLSGENLIISAGGGAFVSPLNAEIAKEKGKIVLIDTSFEECYRRIKDDTKRPIVLQKTKDELNELYDQRKIQYKSNCNVAINGDTNPHNIAKNIIRIMKAK